MIRWLIAGRIANYHSKQPCPRSRNRDKLIKEIVKADVINRIDDKIKEKRL